MTFDSFKQPSGGYLDEKEFYFEDAESWLQTKVLGFCGCGAPELSLAFVRDGLQHIEWRLDSKATWDEKEAKALELFGSEAGAYFFYYFVDRGDLTEHGGSVPGWLTDKGRNFIADVNELEALTQ
jgi:hypothetical protein